jgi:zinc protease
MRHSLRTISTVFLALTALYPSMYCGAADAAADIDIPYQRFVLDNGLTLIVHEDHKAPLVAVNLWYHVGSKNEKPGQTGFAHLFEHLMFNGSEHFNDEYFRPFEKAGATDQNGTTSNDRTNYFATVPKPALDMALWMESDRMAHLLPAIDQAKLDEQRGVVKNEKRQGEDRPFGKVWTHMAKHTYPAGHPYSWLPIGSMEDLDAAKLDDVREWFKQYYGPNNAVLVIAGDIDAQTARQRVEHFFGSIPPGPALQQTDAWIAKRNEEQRATLQDHVPNARVYLVWNTPRATDLASTRFDLIGDLLAGDASSLLNKRLVQEKKLATHIDAANFSQELGGQFWIIADVAPGIEPRRLEREIREALAEFRQRGPSSAELARSRLGYRAALLRRLEKIGGFSGKADLLASGQVLAGDPAYYRRELQETESVTAAQLRDTARAWLDNGVYVLHVLPQPELKAAADTVDRSRVPDPGFAPAPNVPSVQRAQLANGMQLILLRRPELPQRLCARHAAGGEWRPRQRRHRGAHPRPRRRNPNLHAGRQRRRAAIRAEGKYRRQRRAVRAPDPPARLSRRCHRPLAHADAGPHRPGGERRRPARATRPAAPGTGRRQPR